MRARESPRTWRLLVWWKRMRLSAAVRIFLEENAAGIMWTDWAIMR